MKQRPLRITLSSKHIDIIITLLGLTGLGLFLALYDAAFPNAAIDLRLSRQDIRRQAEAVMTAQDYNPAGHEFALAFGQDWLGSIYLQRQLGNNAANLLLQRERLPVYHWQARWFEPLEQEEFRVWLLPDGTLIYFEHIVPEGAAGAALEQGQARQTAEAYLKTQSLWTDHSWDLVTASSEEMPGGRVDHEFSWKRADFSAGEGEVRLSVVMRGDRLGRYQYWFKTPEAFGREFASQRSIANFINNTSYLLGMVGLLGVASWVVIYEYVRGHMPTRRALGVGLFITLVSLASQLNELPLAKYAYDTTVTYSLFWAGRIFSVIITALVAGSVVIGAYAGGHFISKKVWPLEDRVLSRQGNFWVTLSRSAWRGLMVGFGLGGYAVLFYLAATQLFGGWMPMSPDYSSIYATPLPFISVLEAGLIPGFTEELIFRLVGISFVLYLTRSRWLALLVPGVLWAFAHLAYVRDPIYLRGIELLFTAVFIEGLIFLRFGLATTIMAHFVYNAGITALPLLRSDDPYFIVMGGMVVGVMLIPLVPGMVILWRQSRPAGASPVIQPATPADLLGLAALPVAGIQWSKLLDDSRKVVLCLKTGTHVIGAAVGELEPPTGEPGQAPAPAAEISVVYVEKSWQGQYWGSRLALSLARALEAKGAADVYVMISAHSKGWISFWAGLGWPVDTQVYRYAPVQTYWEGWQKGFQHLFSRRGDRDQLTARATEAVD